MFVKEWRGVHIFNAHFGAPYKCVDTSYFVNFLNYLQSVGEIIDFSKAVEIVSSGTILTDKPLFAFSFDDGFLDCYNIIFPELERRGIQAGFFINSFLIDSPPSIKEAIIKRIDTQGKSFMNWDMIKCLHKKGQIIGSHGSGHLRYSNISWNDFEKDVLSNEHEILNNCGVCVKYFAWPYGRNSDITTAQVSFLRKKYDFILGGDCYKSYLSFSGNVINRRHVEPFWPHSHIKYFISHEKNISAD